MYLRTPKRYQPGHKRRHMFSTRWLWLWILTPLILVGGWLVYQQRDQIGPPVRQFISNAFDNARGGLATITAPTALPTTDPADHIVRGDNAWSQGAIEQAITEYGAAVSGAPNNEQVHFRYTYGLLIEGSDVQALTAAEATVTADPFSADAWAIRALALDRSGRYPEAVASAMQALALDPKSATALAFLAQVYLDAGQPATAQEKANLALQADPNSAEAHNALGLFNYGSSYDFNTALQEFQAAQNLAPNLPQIAVNIGWTDWKLENNTAALDELNQVIGNNPNNLDALYALGYIQYQANGDANKAVDYLNRCLQIDAKNYSCLNYLATVKSLTGDPQAAAALYQRIIDAGTQSSIDYLHAGRTYANLNQCDKANPLLRQGYQLEEQQSEPNTDRIAAFEQFMSQCGAPFAPPSSNGTQNAPLLIPLDNGTATSP